MSSIACCKESEQLELLKKICSNWRQTRRIGGESVELKRGSLNLLELESRQGSTTLVESPRILGGRFSLM